MIKKALYIAFTSCFLTSHLKPTIVVGDPAATAGTTFSFNVGFAKFNQSDNRSRLWTASGQTITNDLAKPYALSYIDQIPSEPIANPATGQQYFPTAWPMANPEGAFIFSYNPTTGLVETTSVANPIYGEAFAFFDIFQNKPLFVMKSDLSKLYYGYDIDHPPVGTTQRFNKTELLQYNLGAGETTAALLGALDGIYAAYSSGVFGTAPSSIAKLIQKTQSQKDSEKPLPYLELLASKSISKSTPALTNNSADLANLGSNIAFSSFASMTYAGIQATASNSSGATATGIMLINTVLTDAIYSLTFTPIAESSAISTTFNTIISAPTNQSIRIKNIAAMITSTSLNYLIVARDNGTGPQSIYAAPLVSKPGEGYGQIADFTQINNKFGEGTSSFYQRYFDTPLTDSSQIEIGGAYENQITVGGTIPLANGNIERLYAVGDSVYIVIGSPYATGTEPGTFQSQAIFSQDGHIINWTPWARVLGSDNPMLYSTINGSSTSNFYVNDPTRTGTTFNTVVQTQWTAYQNLSTMFQFSAGAKGGVQGLFNFGQTTPGFNNEMSLLATTGFNNVTIGQTGAVSGGNFQILNMNNTSDVASFNNVNNSKALVALELAHSGANHWLFAGGVNGLNVLTDNTTGCTQIGNFTSVANFKAGQTWKQVGSFSYVKKLIWDETFLYVLTPSTLYQIELNPNKFTESPTVDLNAKVIMPSSTLAHNSYFLDLIIDNGFCIAGTTQGLFSFKTTSGSAKNVVPVHIPDGLAAISQLFVISNSTTPQKDFKTVSNLIVLNNNFATQQARINRFVIINETINPFNDAILNNKENPNGIPTSLIKFNQYVSNYFTDGSWNFASNYFLGVTQPKTVQSPSLLQLFSGLKNGKSSSQSILHLSSAYVPAQFLKQTNMFLGISRESTSGAYIASGNFPARINA